MSRPVCANCLCLIDETGCGCVELNAGGEPVKNATYWKRQYDKLADRIAELEKQLCVCQEPLSPNTVHKKDKPCYVKEPLSDEEILEIWKKHSNYGAVISVFDFAHELEAKVRGEK